MMKSNVIVKNPEIMKGIYAEKDGRFITNKYGYISNIRDPEILEEYERFRKLRKSKILSDYERFHFDTLMVRRFRPELIEQIDEVEKKEGSNLAKLVEKCSGVELCYDPESNEPWLIKTQTESVRETNLIIAIGIFIEKSDSALRRRAKTYCEKNGLNPYTGEAV